MSPCFVRIVVLRKRNERSVLVLRRFYSYGVVILRNIRPQILSMEALIEIVALALILIGIILIGIFDALMYYYWNVVYGPLSV